MNRINLVILLDRLEEMLVNAPRMPVVGKSLVDVDEAVELLQKIRNTVPEEVKRAERISGDRDRMLQASKEQAERIVSQAEEYAQKLINESNLVQEAKAEADKILSSAKAKAEQLERDANAYAAEVLDKLEEQLKATLKVVANGKDKLAV